MDHQVSASLTEAEMLVKVLDQFAFGVIVVDRGLAIRYANPYSRMLLESAWPGYSRERRILDSSSVLRSRIGALVERGEGAITLPREAGQPPLELIVTRLTGIPAKEELALICMVDPAHVPSSFRERLQELYEVSTAEARVAVALGRGARLEDGARELGIGLETVRSHVKALCKKLGVNRMAELLWRLNAGAATLIVSSDWLSTFQDFL